ncbi:zinc-binding alcohol dehydrogenase domain-containing protein cipB [Aspergillus udagawae]|uniref:Zinc-binding alcohol dehydrogenase domain-containing protein cipB n=1 Tax=Aspergillus udagawae TaxID=91492 RepID=A0ABQ1ATE2_9EURO|nr:zinc-binding alcohol dehydrogenase domain-containing protein cipB [Aspergillus udagawae]GFF87738.1 zinc-binding alcohol dehydrogenase domain-containing protein cipB [Aspergillus udagawae]
MTPKNQAAWIPAKKARPFKVGDAPYTPPGSGQVVVKNTAVAINPFDWVLQFIGPAVAGYIKYPFIFGTDVAGEVVEVGPDVERFQVGDRVFGSATAIAKEVNRPAEGGFQLYTVMREHLLAPTPAHITDEQACVMGLGLGTAAWGLFHPDYLGLDMPRIPAPTDAVGKSGLPRTVIITGGASSVGSNAVQLAVSAGYQVISTSSPRNFDYVKSLGATHVFDYRSRTLVKDLLAALQGRELVGAYTIGRGAVEACTAVMRHHDVHLTRKRIAVAGAIIPADKLTTFVGKGTYLIGMVSGMIKSTGRRLRTGIEAKFILLDGLVDAESVVARIYTNFLPQALEQRQFVPAPPPHVVGKGLNMIQGALDLQRKGVSGKKLVVTV